MSALIDLSTGTQSIRASQRIANTLYAEENGAPVSEREQVNAVASELEHGLTKQIGAMMTGRRSSTSSEIREARINWAVARWMRVSLLRPWVNMVYTEVIEGLRLAHEQGRSLGNVRHRDTENGKLDTLMHIYSAQVGEAETRAYLRMARHVGFDILYGLADKWTWIAGDSARDLIKLEFPVYKNAKDLLKAHPEPYVRKLVSYTQHAASIASIVRSNSDGLRTFQIPFAFELQSDVLRRNSSANPWALWRGYAAEMSAPAAYSIARVRKAMEADLFADELLEAFSSGRPLNDHGIWKHHPFNVDRFAAAISRCAGTPSLEVAQRSNGTAEWFNQVLDDASLALGRIPPLRDPKTLNAAVVQTFLFGEIGELVFPGCRDYAAAVEEERRREADRLSEKTKEGDHEALLGLWACLLGHEPVFADEQAIRDRASATREGDFAVQL